MKYILISKEKNQYVANLHCHTTLSDGRKTPEEIRDAYKEQGYSIVAFSDHDNYFDHSDFCTDDFVAINSFEADISDNVVSSSIFIYYYYYFFTFLLSLVDLQCCVSFRYTAK